MENRNNPFLHEATFIVRAVLSTSIAALALGSAAHAVDYNFGSVTQNFTLTATDQARAIGNNLGTFNDNKGAIYWRGAPNDVTYAHFNLASLAGGTINGTVNLNFSRTTCPARAPKTTASQTSWNTSCKVVIPQFPSPALCRLWTPPVRILSSPTTAVLPPPAPPRSLNTAPPSPAGRRLRYPAVQLQSSLRAQASTRSKSPSPKVPKPNSSAASKW